MHKQISGSRIGYGGWATIVAFSFAVWCGRAVGSQLPVEDPAARCRLQWTRSLKWSNVASVEDFDGDSVEERLEKARQAVGARGAVVYFPPGNYAFRKFLALKDGVILRGPDGTPQTHPWGFRKGTVIRNNRHISLGGKIINNANAVRENNTGGEVPAVSSGREAPGGWERLNLKETTIAGTKVFYESVLEPNLPVFEQQLTKFAADRGKHAEILTRRREIIADINHILGVTDPNVEEQSKSFVKFAGLFSRTKLTFYLARMATIKDFLRSGGQLPNFTYDRQSDIATYNPQIRVPKIEKPLERYDFCIPIPLDKEFGEYVAGIFNMLRTFMGSGPTGVAIHEVTEYTLLRRARPTDPYRRWFSDGFANAITCDLVEKYMGEDAAKEFAAAYDPNDNRDLENQVNLRYWMPPNFCVYTSDVPVAAEEKIHYARYTYSMVEARRLIDTHGIDCVREILDRIAAMDKRGGSDLLRVIKDVTGEDMEPRLARYQAFETRQQGITKYSEAFNAASKQNDYEQMFVNLVRVMELREDRPSLNDLQSFLNAALLLHKMGHEAASDAAMQNAVDLYSKDSIVNGRQAAAEAFVYYALNCDHPQKARKMADEVLQAAPEHVPALVVKMLISRDEANLAEARRYATEVCRLADERSKAYRVASEVLALDPNQPPAYKGPAEQK